MILVDGEPTVVRTSCKVGFRRTVILDNRNSKAIMKSAKGHVVYNLIIELEFGAMTQ